MDATRQLHTSDALFVNNNHLVDVGRVVPASVWMQ
jgi:hypothetical protein